MARTMKPLALELMIWQDRIFSGCSWIVVGNFLVDNVSSSDGNLTRGQGFKDSCQEIFFLLRNCVII